jgi:hypothetical protein
MPAKFDACMRSKGHKVRTIHPGGHAASYAPVCITMGGQTVMGELHRKKTGGSGSGAKKKLAAK